MLRQLLIALFLIALCISAGWVYLTHGPTKSPQPQMADLFKHPARNPDTWQDRFQWSLNQRITEVPQVVVDYIQLDNKLHNYPNRPRPATKQAQFIEETREALSELPPEVQKMAAQKVAGIFFVEDLGGSGYTESVLAGKSELYGFIVLDAKAVDRTANEWATWKENTPFKPDPQLEIRAIIESPLLSNRKNAIQYILLHEIAHALAIGENIHPSWTFPEQNKNPQVYQFSGIDWRMTEDQKVVSRFFDLIPEIKDVVYYFGAKLEASQAINIYKRLSRTSHVSLYAATSIYEDWAESFVTYVHHKMLGRPYSIQLIQNRQLVHEHTLCWGSYRCRSKMAFIENFIREKSK